VIIEKSERYTMKRKYKLIIVSFVFAFFIISQVSGCKKGSGPSPKSDKKAPASTAEALPEGAVAETENDNKGYVYERRDRRDPFVPLIVVAKKTSKSKSDESKRVMGTIESYDIGDFKVLAIARKGDKRYALLLAPGNRAFTVYEGTVLGLHKGTVEKITDNQVRTIERVENYLGKIEARQLILELHKGR